MTNMKPSYINDANKRIVDFKKTLPPTFKAENVKTKGPISDEDKKYIKMGCFPSLNEEETFKYVLDEVISKPFIQSIIDEYKKEDEYRQC